MSSMNVDVNAWSAARVVVTSGKTYGMRVGRAKETQVVAGLRPF